MSDIGWLIVLYILGTLFVLAPWIAVTFMSHYDDKNKKSEKR